MKIYSKALASDATALTGRPSDPIGYAPKAADSKLIKQYGERHGLAKFGDRIRLLAAEALTVAPQRRQQLIQPLVDRGLRHAAGAGHLTAVERLEEAGAQSLAPSKKGDTAWHLAAMNGNDGVVGHLLARNSDADYPNARNADGITALQLAIDSSAFGSAHYATRAPDVARVLLADSRTEFDSANVRLAPAKMRYGRYRVELAIANATGPTYTEPQKREAWNDLNVRAAFIEALVERAVQPAAPSHTRRTAAAVDDGIDIGRA